MKKLPRLLLTTADYGVSNNASLGTDATDEELDQLSKIDGTLAS